MKSNQHATNERAWQASEEERAAFRAAFAGMEPSGETVERILDMTTRSPQRTTRTKPARRFTVRAALATAAVTALLASGAYAATQTEFFQSAFGPKGQQDIAPNEVVLDEKVNPNTGKMGVSYMPERTWVQVDPALAERLVGAYVEQVAQTAQMNGYTLTVEQCLVDENGLGVATVVISNPEGVAYYDSAGIVYIDNDVPVGVAMGVADGTQWSWRMVRDATRSTETELYATAYFGAFAGSIGGEGVSWLLRDNLARDAWREQRAQELEAGVAPDEMTPYEEAYESLVHHPTTAVPATALVSREVAGSVEISPLGLVAYAPVSRDPYDPSDLDQVTLNHLEASLVVVAYADGSEYVVQRSGIEGVNNVNTSLVLSDGTGSGYLFNRLVDVDAVESVTVTWRGLVDGVEYEQEAVYTK